MPIQPLTRFEITITESLRAALEKQLGRSAIAVYCGIGEMGVAESIMYLALNEYDKHNSSTNYLGLNPETDLARTLCAGDDT